MAGRRRGAVRAAVVAAVTAALLMGAGATASTQVVESSVGLSLSSGLITYGDELGATGAVSAAEPCAAGRTVEIQARGPGETAWTTVASAATAEDGTFSLALMPATSASYRAVALQVAVGDVVCRDAASPEAANEVAAAVAATLPRDSVAAGGCIRLTVTVRPGKPGTAVAVQRLRSGGWRTVATAVMDEGSSGRAELCYGWGAIGELALRAVWEQQDPRNAAGDSEPVALRVTRAPWMFAIEDLAAGRAVSVSVREAGAFLYRLFDTVPRVPASNEKLLLSMALLDRLGPGFHVRTQAAGAVVEGVVQGDLWILGHGDPEVGAGKLSLLARRIRDAGVRAVEGSVMGSTGYFGRDWFAPGWKDYFDEDVIALPTALTFRGNTFRGRHLHRPEVRAARFLTEELEALGVEVGGDPGAGAAPEGLPVMAAVGSASLERLLTRQNVDSRNFHAEVLGKLLAAEAVGVPGTIAGGAMAIEAFAESLGAEVTAHDGSGLSYANRATAGGLATLLGVAEGRPWGPALARTLPEPGEGTLEERLDAVPVRAKTGTLDEISALSGYVYLSRLQTWAEFSILSTGMRKSDAVAMEDRIVRILWRSAH